MKLSKKFAPWKIGAMVAVGLLVLADVALCGVLWQLGREAPEDMKAQRTQLANTAAQLEKDVARGERIRSELGQVGKNSDDFYQTSFMDSRDVYSTVDADIATIATKAGVKTAGFQFHSNPVANRNVAQLDITMTVDGDYPALLQFVNGIERSKNFYFLNQLQLASSAPNGIRLQLDLHTYYRT
jgi:Tfp pilus assembly protein PilO